MTSNKKIMTAVVTGGHPFNVIAFSELFGSLDSVDPYFQHLDEFSADARNRDRYDVVLFYHMFFPTPDDQGEKAEQKVRAALELLGQTQQGIFVLHHATLAYPDWDLWTDVVGIPDRRFDYHLDQHLSCAVEPPDHPITREIGDFTIDDETYTMASAEADQGNTVLLTTQHTPSMRTLAWTRTFGKSPVFCYQAGHNHQAYEHPQFRALVERGIQWCAGRI